MVALITCDYCENGDHTNCMEDYESPNKGITNPMKMVDGGKSCICCGGLSYDEKLKKEKEQALDNLVEQGQELDLYDFPDYD